MEMKVEEFKLIGSFGVQSYSMKAIMDKSGRYFARNSQFERDSTKAKLYRSQKEIEKDLNHYGVDMFRGCKIMNVKFTPTVKRDEFDVAKFFFKKAVKEAGDL